MRALVGYAALFIAIGIIIGYFVAGFMEFIITVALLVWAYILLCRGC